jgi:hypothetical protein
LSGCGISPAQWEVTVENRSSAPCSVLVTLGKDANSTAEVNALPAGSAATLIAGNIPTVVQNIKVVSGEDQQTLSPRADLPVGKRFAIVIAPSGKVETIVSER